MQVELILLVLSLLFFASIFTDKIGYKFGIPALLLFLAVGMLFGPDGLGKLINEDGVGYMLNVGSAQAIGTIALCIILFSGGLDTKLSDIRPVIAPGLTLATIGVLLTMLITGVIIYFVFGWFSAIAAVSLPIAMLMASTMSSTDSASVFSILRTNGIGLKHNLRPLLELESGANDPMAYVLTTTLIGVVTATGGSVTALTVVQDIVVQLVMGAVMGFLFGKGIVRLMRRSQLGNESLYPIMVLTACIFIFSATYYLKGNTYLAVYIGGLVIGNSKFTRKRQTRSFFDGLTWLSQLVVFLVLGLMVRPHELFQLEVILAGLIISVVMMFISRPLSVFLCMIPHKNYRTNDKLLLSWVGLKGAVPIIFAILCKANEVPNADLIFNIVFLCTLLSLIVQGSSLSAMARKLRLTMPPQEQKKLQYFDIDLPEEVESVATEMEVTTEMLDNGTRLKDIKFDSKLLIIMVRRGEEFFVPTGDSELEVGDQLLIISDSAANATEQFIEDSDAEIYDHWGMYLINHTMDFAKQKWNQLLHPKKEKKF
jgi:cell volume regulation protein A